MKLLVVSDHVEERVGIHECVFVLGEVETAIYVVVTGFHDGVVIEDYSRVCIFADVCVSSDSAYDVGVFIGWYIWAASIYKCDNFIRIDGFCDDFSHFFIRVYV